MPRYETGNPEHNASGSLLTPGEYEVRCVDAKNKRSEKGNDMIEMVCRAVLPDGSESRKMFVHLVFISSCYWKIDQFLAAIGLHPGEGKSIDIDASDCIGQKFRAKVGVEKDRKGVEQNVIEEFIFNAGGDDGLF